VTTETPKTAEAVSQLEAQKEAFIQEEKVSYGLEFGNQLLDDQALVSRFEESTNPEWLFWALGIINVVLLTVIVFLLKERCKRRFSAVQQE
jgi:hypothetical protein